MPAPKRQRIINAIVDRLETAGVTVRRDRQMPHAAECPVYAVYSNERTNEERKNLRTRCAMTVTVVGFREFTNDAETEGNEILAEIMQAIETSDKTLDGLLVNQPGLSFETETIYLPEAGEGVVAAEIVYATPHIRIDGDPEIE